MNVLKVCAIFCVLAKVEVSGRNISISNDEEMRKSESDKGETVKTDEEMMRKIEILILFHRVHQSSEFKDFWVQETVGFQRDSRCIGEMSRKLQGVLERAGEIWALGAEKLVRTIDKWRWRLKWDVKKLV
jgi:hypothetical protein